MLIEETSDHQRIFKMNTFTVTYACTNQSRLRKTVDLRQPYHNSFQCATSNYVHHCDRYWFYFFECSVFVLKKKIESMNNNKKVVKKTTKKQPAKEKEQNEERPKRAKRNQTTPEDLEHNAIETQQSKKRVNRTQRNNTRSKSSATNATGLYEN